jgi:hypothetical protein
MTAMRDAAGARRWVRRRVGADRSRHPAGPIGPGGAETCSDADGLDLVAVDDMADADNLAKLLRYQAARVPLRLGQNGCGMPSASRLRGLDEVPEEGLEPPTRGL